MKKLMIISLLFFTAINFTSLYAQRAGRLIDEVDELENAITEQKTKIEAQKQKIKDAQSAVDEQIKKDKEFAEKFPKAHGVNEELNALKEALQNERDQLEADKTDLAELEEELRKTKEKLEKKLQKAVEDILKKNPLPDSEEELDEFEKKIKELESKPRHAKLEEELRKRIQKRIDAKRKELEEQSALPGSQNQRGSNGREAIAHPNTNSEWTVGLHYDSWPGADAPFSNTHPDEVNQVIYGDAALFEKLFESLGGEFFLGSFSEPPNFVNPISGRQHFFGVNGAYWWNDRFALEAGFSKGRSSSSIEFPITVIELDEGNTRALLGRLNTAQNFYAARLYAQLALFTGWMKAIISGGVDYQDRSPYEVIATMEDIRFALKEVKRQRNVYAGGAVAAQFRLLDQLSLEASLKARKIEKKVQVGAGIRLQVHLNK